MVYESYKADNQNVAATKAKVTGLLKKFHSYDFLVAVETWFTWYYGASIKNIWNKLLPHQIPPIKKTLMTLEMKVDQIGNEDEFLYSCVCCYKVAAVDRMIVFLVNLFVQGKKGKK